MSVAGTIRGNLETAIAALVPEATIYQARVPQAIFEVAVRKLAIVIAYAGKPKLREGPVSHRDRQRFAFSFVIAIVAEDWQTPEGAAYSAADVAERLMPLRNVQVATVNGNPLYLAFESEAPEVNPGATAQGGEYAMVQQWRTNEVTT